MNRFNGFRFAIRVGSLCVSAAVRRFVLLRVISWIVDLTLRKTIHEITQKTRSALQSKTHSSTSE
jgi:hypothetical protein